jgi:hypothetical protein
MNTAIEDGNDIDIHSSSTNSLYNSVQSQLIKDSIIINQLDVADGLKNLLISHDFTLKLLLSVSSTDLAEILGIDEYVARMIIDAAYAIKKKS